MPVIVIYVWRQQPTWSTFKQRFWLRQLPGFGLPPVVPEIFVDPYAAIAPESGVTTFMGVPLQPQNAWLMPVWLVWVVGGVLGERKR